MLWRNVLIGLFLLFTSASAEKIISLAPNLTELICYLGGEQKLVGITGDCNYPAAIKNKTKVGKYQFPSIEAIIALQPAIVIAEDTADKRFLKKLDTLHIPYKLYPLQNLTDIVPTGKKLAQDLQLKTKPLDKLEKKLQRPLPEKLQPAIIILWAQPLIAAGTGTFINDYWLRKGYQNIVSTKGYPIINKELLLANPQAKLIDLSQMDNDIYMRLSPRLIETL